MQADYLCSTLTRPMGGEGSCRRWQYGRIWRELDIGILHSNHRDLSMSSLNLLLCKYATAVAEANYKYLNACTNVHCACMALTGFNVIVPC